MENKIQVGDKVQLTMISREGVALQRYIPKLEEVYTIAELTEKYIKLNHTKYGDYTYYKGQIRLRKADNSTSGRVA